MESVVEAPQKKAIKPKRKSALVGHVYKAVWRWHFWAGLVSAPFLIIMAVTGALWVFHEELDPLLYPELLVVTPSEATVSLDTMRAQVEAHYPASSVRNVNIPKRTDRAWSFFLRPLEAGDETKNASASAFEGSVFFDPYKGEVLGSRTRYEGFFAVVLKIHRTFLAGTLGRVLSETATSWGIISMLTGLYLWWAGSKEKVWGKWLPRVRGKFKVVLRDWHTVPGMYIAVFAIAVMFTGLLFTQVWGRAWFMSHALTGGLPEGFVNQPKSVLIEGEPAPEQVSLDSALATAKAVLNHDEDSHRLEVPTSGTDQSFRYMNEIMNPFVRRAIVIIDQYSGEILLTETSEMMPLRTHLTLLFYPIHVGSIFGTPTKILAVITCFLIVVMSVTGVWMWWRRRPSGSWGAPVKPPPRTIPRWMAWFTVGMVIFFPMAGLTLVLIGLASWTGRLIKKA